MRSRERDRGRLIERESDDGGLFNINGYYKILKMKVQFSRFVALGDMTAVCVGVDFYNII